MIPFLYAASVFVAGRILWYPALGPRGALRVALIALGQVLALLAGLRGGGTGEGLFLWAPLPLAALAVALENLLRRRPTAALWSRLLVLVLGLAALSYATRAGAALVRPEMGEAGRFIAARFAAGEVVLHFREAALWARLLGLLACVSEAGTLVQVCMAVLRVPAPLNGRFRSSAVIGSVERLLVLVFVFHGAFGAIAFILTAKGVVRFHELTAEGAAEYVLVGTLFSTLSAIGIGLFVPLLS